jgi:hypothetical protein
MCVDPWSVKPTTQHKWCVPHTQLLLPMRNNNCNHAAASTQATAKHNLQERHNYKHNYNSCEPLDHTCQQTCDL